MRKLRLFGLVMALFASVALISCSSTSSYTTGIGSMDESRAENKEGADVPRLHFAISVLFRKRPPEGAVSQIASGLFNTLQSGTQSAFPWAVAGTGITQPGAMLSEIEGGKRWQLYLPVYIDIPRGRNVDLTYEMTGQDIKQALKNVAADVNLNNLVERVGVQKVRFEYHSSDK